MTVQYHAERMEIAIKTPTYTEEEIVQETLRLLNKERSRLELNELEMKQYLNGFAKWKSNYLVRHNGGKLNHTPHGKSIDEQLREAGFDNITWAGENLASSNCRNMGHFVSPKEKSVFFVEKELAGLYNSWYNSKGHYDNMIRQGPKYIGIAAFNEYDKKGMRVYTLITSR